MIVYDSAEDGFAGTIEIAYLRAMHKVTDPEVVYVIGLEGFADIRAMVKRKPALGFNDTEQSIIVDGGITE
jgi:hypothetical protein